MNTANYKRHTLSVLVENAAGVLSQVSRLFSRKGYNIESLAVGTTDDPAISRITIEIDTDDASARQIANQLRKLFPVYSVQELSPDDSIRRELVMIKVRAANSEDRNEVIQIANIFRASIIDVSLNSLTIAIIGAESKVDAIQKLLQGFGILEMVRTGMVALERGGSTINDNNKEKGSACGIVFIPQTEPCFIFYRPVSPERMARSYSSSGHIVRTFSVHCFLIGNNASHKESTTPEVQTPVPR